MRKRSWISCAMALALGMGAVGSASAQLYFAGQFGAGNTWNVYETRGSGTLSGSGRQAFVGGVTIETGNSGTWVQVRADADLVTLTLNGTTYNGHMVTFSDPVKGPDENDFIANHPAAPTGDHWIGLTDNSVYGGVDTGVGDTHTDRSAGWAWQAPGEAYVDIGRWGGGEPNDCCGSEDAAHMRGDNLWNDHGNGTAGQAAPSFPYVMEYETHLATEPTFPPLPELDPTIRKTPGPLSHTDGKMAVREIYQNGTVAGNSGALRSAFAPGGIVYDYESSVMNIFNSGGEGGFGANHNYGLIESGTVPAGDLEDVAIVAHGRIRIPEGQGGVYTFGHNTDDSGELWIYDKTFTNITNGNGTSTYGSLLFAADRGPGHTLGQVTLDPGDYDFEFVANERGGGSGFELYAAKGAFTAFDGNVMNLVGAPAFNFNGTTPKLSGAGWTATEVLVLPENSNNIINLAQAKGIVAAPDPAYVVKNGTYTGINLGDPFNGANQGRFPADTPFMVDEGLGFDDNDFVHHSTATLEITTAGDYTFGFASDDGAELTITGANFHDVRSAVGAVLNNNNQTITADALTGDSQTTAVTHLEPGNYPMEFWFFERGGGAFAEVFVSPIAADGFDARIFRILDNTNQAINVNSAGGLQLVKQEDEPIGGLGDTDLDGDVDLDDLNNVRNFFGTPSEEGDADHDGDTDLDDLNAVRNFFGGPPGSASVPEPSSILLCGLGVVGLLAARRFRK